MSFGKRTPERHSTAVDVTGPFYAPVIGAYRALPKWSRQLMSFAGCIAGMTAFGLTYFKIDTSLPRSSAPVFSEPSPKFEVVTELPVDRVSFAVANHNHALRRSCLGSAGSDNIRYEIDPFSDARLPRMDPTDGKIRIHPGNGGVFLACILSRELMRLCVPTERARVVAALSEFAVIQAEYSRLKANAQKSGMGRMDAKLNGKPEEDEIMGAEINTLLDGNLARALEKVTKAGYLSVGNFGRSPPIGITPYIAKPNAEPCKP